ncbi:MAG: transposase [Proteobacteria bacterium]|nr:transposase [Pseudomonadota bacterium]
MEKRLNPSLRQIHKAGEMMLVDYSGQTVAIAEPRSGEAFQAEVYMAVPGAGNYTYAEALPGQDLSRWINSDVNAMRFFGGARRSSCPTTSSRR